MTTERPIHEFPALEGFKNVPVDNTNQVWCVSSLYEGDMEKMAAAGGAWVKTTRGPALRLVKATSDGKPAAFRYQGPRVEYQGKLAILTQDAPEFEPSTPVVVTHQAPASPFASDAERDEFEQFKAWKAAQNGQTTAESMSAGQAVLATAARNVATQTLTNQVPAVVNATGLEATKAPYGRDENGTPLAPYGRKKTGDPAKRPGRKAASTNGNTKRSNTSKATKRSNGARSTQAKLAAELDAERQAKLAAAQDAEVNANVVPFEAIDADEFLNI